MSTHKVLAKLKKAPLLEAKWKQVLDKGGQFTNTYRRASTAVLLENQAKYLQEAAGQFGPFQSSGVGVFQTAAIPIVKRMYARLIAPDIVGQQPMTGPASLAFFMRYKYVNSDGSTRDILQPGGTNRIWGDGADGSDIAVEFDPYYSSGLKVWNDAAVVGSILPNLPATVTVTGSAGTVDSDCLGNQLVDGSEEITISGTYTETGPGVTVSFNQTFVYGALETTKALVVTAGGDSVTIDLNLTRNLVAADSIDVNISVISVGSSLLISDVHARSAIGGPVSTTAGAIGYANCNTLNDQACAPYQLPAFENSSFINDVRFEIETRPIAPQTRKLRTGWTFESAQDLKALHGIDAEQELTNLAATEIAAEIDREILGDLLKIAVHRSTWYSRPPIHVAGTGVAMALHSSLKDWYETLVFKVIEMGNRIYKSTIRGAANFMVCDPFSATFIESIHDFRADNLTADETYNIGIMKMGTLANKLTVYKDPLFPKGHILVGFKGASPLDTGYVYAPYVPLEILPTVLDPLSGVPRKILQTRYGKICLLDSGYFYGVIRVLDGSEPQALYPSA